MSRHTSSLFGTKGVVWSWLVSGVPCLLLATNLCWVSVGVHSVKTSSDTQSTDQLSQSTGCLSFQRPIVTEENIKLHPSHCLCSALHEVILCLTWLSQLGWRSEKGAGWCAGGSHRSVQRYALPGWLPSLASSAGPVEYLAYSPGKLRQKSQRWRAGCHLLFQLISFGSSSFQCNRCWLFLFFKLIENLILFGQLLRRF